MAKYLSNLFQQQNAQCVEHNGKDYIIIMERYKLDNGEIIECDYINFVHLVKIDVQDLKLRPKAFRKDFIKGCTWGLANGYSHVLIIQYYIKCKFYIKCISTNKPCNDIHYWLRHHKIHEDD